jgi:hypothetical protein
MERQDETQQWRRLRKKERQDETQIITKFVGKTSLGPSNSAL